MQELEDGADFDSTASARELQNYPSIPMRDLIYMVRRLAFPAPPHPMVWSGRGGGRVCGEGRGPLELQLEKRPGEKRPGITDQASIVRKTYVCHKS